MLLLLLLLLSHFSRVRLLGTPWTVYFQYKIAERNINNLRYADDTTLMAESKEGLKKLLMKVKEESVKLA